MKNLILIIRNKKTFILTRSTFFVIFICGQIVAMATILTATGAAQMSFNENKETDLYMTGVRFEVYFFNTDIEITGDEWLKKMKVIRDWMGEDLESIEMVSWTKGDEESKVFTMYYESEEEYSSKPRGKEMLTYEELLSDEHLIVLKDNKNSDVKPGTKIEFDGEAYTVKGIKNVIDPVVPIGAIPKQNIVFSTSVISTDTLTKAKAQQITEKIQEVFETDAKVDVMSGTELVDLQANNTGKYIVALAAIIILLNSFVCYRYILEYRRRWLSIVRMLGCSVKRAFGIYEGELMIILTFCAMVGTVLFRFVIYPIMYNKSSMYEEIYVFSTYGFSILLYMLTAFIIITASVIPLVSKSVIELKNRN